MTHNDQPALDCCLNRDRFRDLVLRQITEAQPPKTIGIHGTWGTGKTSLLKQLYADLGGEHSLSAPELAAFKASERSNDFEDRFKPIWFEAWQYQHEPNILAVLLKEIRDQLSWGWQTWDKAGKALDVAAISVLQNIKLTVDGFGFNFGQQVRDTRTRAREVQEQDLSLPLDSVTHKGLLKEAIDKLLNLKYFIGIPKENKKNRRAVIFIDDLDRCEPDAAFRILESIKVYLSLDNCIFVLGMDSQEVERILAKKYEQQFESNELGRHHLRNQARLYLEKICQDIHQLPVLNFSERAAYLDRLLCHEVDIENNEGILPETVIKEIVSIAGEHSALPPYPRSIKIFANVLLSHGTRPEIADQLTNPENGEISVFYIMAYFYAFYPDIYRLCYLYDDFYQTQLFAYIDNPASFSREYTGQDSNDSGTPQVHKLLANVQLTHMPSTDPGGMDPTTDRQFHKRYPHESLRQVLWITQLVRETGNIPESIITRLQF